MIYVYKAELIIHIYHRIPIKSKIGGKILSQKHVKTSFYDYFLIHDNSRCGLRTFGLPVCSQTICDVEYLKREGMNYQQA